MNLVFPEFNNAVQILSMAWHQAVFGHPGRRIDSMTFHALMTCSCEEALPLAEAAICSIGCGWPWLMCSFILTAALCVPQETSWDRPR